MFRNVRSSMRVNTDRNIPDGTPPAPAPAGVDCKICTIHLELLCYRRAWWFRAFRETLATGIRLFALAYRIPADRHRARSPMCFKCLRFRKNALKQRSPLFNLLDARLNPLFNRVRDSLLTADELERARRLARQAEDPGFGMGLAELPASPSHRSRA